MVSTTACAVAAISAGTTETFGVGEPSVEGASAGPMSSSVGRSDGGPVAVAPGCARRTHPSCRVPSHSCQWLDWLVSVRSSRVVILGGGPGGYEAALVAAHLGAEVTVVERDGLGGAAVLTDCVPSKTLISTADYMSEFETAAELGVHLEDAEGDEVSDAVAELGEVNRRVLSLAAAQSADIATRLAEVGVRVVVGRAALASPTEVRTETAADVEELETDVVLLATGATP